MTKKMDKIWHLAQTDIELEVAEFEILIWRISEAFMRWQIDATSCVSSFDLTAPDIAILHIIRAKNRPKTANDIAKLLNRDDNFNIAYSIRKLMKFGLVRYASKAKLKKARSKYFEITPLGVKETDAYLEVKRDLLIDKFKALFDAGLDLKPVTSALGILTGTYDEASRLATIYRGDE